MTNIVLLSRSPSLRTLRTDATPSTKLNHHDHCAEFENQPLTSTMTSVGTLEKKQT